MKRSTLARRTPLRARPKPRELEPGRDEWKAPQSGVCPVCGLFFAHLDRHHVLYMQVLRRTQGDRWDLRNSLLVCRGCHFDHHSAMRRISIDLVPAVAIAFAVELLGGDLAALFFEREYSA